jgi:predicted ATPase
VGSVDSQLLGRELELERLEAVLGAAAGGRASTAAVLGEPGIGKSRLIAEGLAGVTDPRTVIAHGRASEFERQLPFGVLIDALDAYLASVGPRRLTMLNQAQAALLATIFPALDRPTDPGAIRPEPSQLHHALRALLQALASQQRLVLALDDLHWADQASVELLAHLLHRPVPATTVLIAFRPAQASRLLRNVVNAGCETGACVEITLEPLSPDEAATLLEGIPDAKRREWIYREAGGNPFYLQQLARAAAGSASVAETTDLPGVPVAVARALASELAELPVATRLVLDAGSVAGEPFESELVSAISGVQRSLVLVAFDDALQRGVIVTTAAPGRFEFRHPIVRRAVYASAPPAWLTEAHDRAAHTLGALGARASARAYHVELSGREGDQEAQTLFVEAARESVRVAPASAARWYSAALRALPADAQLERRLSLLAALAAAQTAAGDLAAASETLEEILELLPDEQTALRLRPLVAMALIERLLGRVGPARQKLVTALAGSVDASAPAVAALELELAADRYFAGDWGGNENARAGCVVPRAESRGHQLDRRRGLGARACGAQLGPTVGGSPARDRGRQDARSDTRP